MPRYRITPDWSDPIDVLARDVLQSQGAFPVEICPQDPALDTTSLRLPPTTGSLQVDGPMTVRARCLNGVGVLAVVRGF